MRIRLVLWFSLFMCLSLLTSHLSVQAQSFVPDYPVDRMALSGDGTRLAVVGHTITTDEYNSFIDILDASTLEILQHFEIEHQPSLLAFSPDGHWVAYYVDYIGLTAIDTLIGETLQIAGGGPAEVGNMDWSPTDGRLAYSVGRGLSISQLYGDLPTAHLIDEESLGAIGGIDWSHSGHDLATTTYNFQDGDNSNIVTNIQIWREAQIAVGGIVDTPSNRFSGIGGFLAWSPSDELIASSNGEGIGIFDVSTGEQTVFLSTEGINSMTWSPDGTQIAAGGLNVIWIWDTASSELIDTITFDGVATALVWLPDLGLIHNGSANGLYQNGSLVTAPIEVTPEVTPTN